MAGVRHTESLDLITFDEKNNRLKLIMVEERQWDEDSEMYQQLQEKINSYLTFIESGQLKENYPEYCDKKILIQLDMAFEPSGYIVQLIPRIRKVFKEQNIEFITNKIDV